MRMFGRSQSINLTRSPQIFLNVQLQVFRITVSNAVKHVANPTRRSPLIPLTQRISSEVNVIECYSNKLADYICVGGSGRLGD